MKKNIVLCLCRLLRASAPLPAMPEGTGNGRAQSDREAAGFASGCGMIAAAGIFLMFVLCGSSVAWAYTAHVKTVSDGDSLTVSGADGAVVHVRLYGIDAPEYKQSYGLQAKKRLAKLVSRKDVEVEAVGTDRYGRTVALVRREGGVLVNEAMVAEGYAWVYGQYCRQETLCQRLRELQDRARAERLGLWQEDDPLRPADWRREHNVEEWYKTPVWIVKSVARKVKGAIHR